MNNRDITRVSLGPSEDWLIASDISSGIGLQEHDVLQVPYPHGGGLCYTSGDVGNTLC